MEMLRFSRRIGFAASVLLAAAALTLATQARLALGDTSSSTATSNVADWFSTSSGWKTNKVWYTDSAKDVPVGAWEYQYQHSFNAAAPPAFSTWYTFNKPLAATWGSTAAQTSTQTTTGPLNPTKTYATSYGYVNPYSLFIVGGYFAKKQTKSTANASKADTQAVSSTQITDPTTVLAPATDSTWNTTSYPLDPTGHWGVRTDYSQFGSFTSAVPGSSITDSYGITLNPTSPSGTPVTFNLLTIKLTAGGTASVTTDLNGNDATVSGSLNAGQLNGVLRYNGSDVTSSQAEADLLSYYSAVAGWQLNPNGYTPSNFQPDNSTNTSSVFTLTAEAFLDSSTSTATVTETNGSSAVALATPEPTPLSMLVAGSSVLLFVARKRRGKGAQRESRNSLGPDNY